MVSGVLSDERGLQSLQIIAYIASAYSVCGLNETSKEILKIAYEQLTNETNQYNENIRNLKITVPIDDNYSDDELSYLPLFTFLNVCRDVKTCVLSEKQLLMV